MLDDNCIFCKIIRGEIPSAKVYEDEKALVFRDIAPKAKVHLLAIPKAHFPTLREGLGEYSDYIDHLVRLLPSAAEKGGCAAGYRVVINQGEDAGQTVFHLHAHILGGQPLDW